MVNEILKDTESKMQKAIESMRKEMASIRAGRANPALLEKIQVDYYGVPTPLNQVANISVPEARLLLVQPWDKSIIQDIERAILKSDLGLNPNNDGSVIRIAIPPLTEERRKELVKVVKKKAEEFRVIVRNLRRDANDRVKSMEKNGEISQDELHRGQAEVQKLTDQYIEKVDKLLASKEAEILEV